MPSKPARKVPRRIVETKELAEVLMLTRHRIEQLAKEGLLKRHRRGYFDLVEGVQGYIRFLKDDTRRRGASAAEGRVRDARARDIEVRTAQRLSQLVPLVLYDEMIDSFAGLVRSEFAGLPAAATRDLVMRRIIEREVNARLRRIAEYALAQAIRLEAVRGTDHAVRSDGAGPMGSGEPDIPTNGGGAGSA